MAKKTDKEKSIEQSLEELDNILEKLEDEGVSLEESFEIYEQGMRMIKKINSSIENVEKKMLVIEMDDEDVSD